MVLDHGYAALHAGSLYRSEPLLGVGGCSGGKFVFIFVAISPLIAGVGVHAVMKERIKLCALPLELTGGRHGVYGGGLVFGIHHALVDQLQLGVGGERSCQCQAQSRGPKVDLLHNLFVLDDVSHFVR